LNYLYIYLGNVPDYVQTSINSVLSVDKDAKVYLCSENNPNYKNVDFINLKEMQSALTNDILDLKIYNDTNYDSKINNLWITSLLRIFYLNDFLAFTKLNKIVHFDADVIIYKPFSQIEEVFNQEKLNITKLENDRLIFGYSFVPSEEIMLKICKKIFNFLDQNKKTINFKTNPLNEMQILGNIYREDSSLFNLLPDLPYFDSKEIFDPASYGQYLGGTHDHPIKWYKKKQPTMDHIIGKEIYSKRIKVIFKDDVPLVSYNQKKYKLVNLHVHSKNLNKFTPVEYKKYI